MTEALIPELLKKDLMRHAICLSLYSYNITMAKEPKEYKKMDTTKLRGSISLMPTCKAEEPCVERSEMSQVMSRLIDIVGEERSRIDRLRDHTSSVLRETDEVVFENEAPCIPRSSVPVVNDIEGVIEEIGQNCRMIEDLSNRCEA